GAGCAAERRGPGHLGVTVYWGGCIAPSGVRLAGTSHSREGASVWHPRNRPTSGSPESTEITGSNPPGELPPADLLCQRLDQLATCRPAVHEPRKGRVHDPPTREGVFLSG